MTEKPTLTDAERKALRDVTFKFDFTHQMDAAVESILAARLAAVEAELAVGREQWENEVRRAEVAEAEADYWEKTASSFDLVARQAEQQLADLRASITAKRDEWTPGSDEWAEYDGLLDNPTKP